MASGTPSQNILLLKEEWAQECFLKGIFKPQNSRNFMLENLWQKNDFEETIGEGLGVWV